MKFMLKRTSKYCSNSNPLTPEEMKNSGLVPVRERYDRFDTRRGDDPAKLANSLRTGNTSWWYDEGVDHEIVDGNVRRRFPSGSQGWFIDVPDLDALLRIEKMFGDLVIGGRDPWDCPTPPTLEIYDDYR